MNLTKSGQAQNSWGMEQIENLGPFIYKGGGKGHEDTRNIKCFLLWSFSQPVIVFFICCLCHPYRDAGQSLQVHALTGSLDPTLLGTRGPPNAGGPASVWADVPRPSRGWGRQPPFPVTPPTVDRRPLRDYSLHASLGAGVASTEPHLRAQHPPLPPLLPRPGWRVAVVAEQGQRGEARQGQSTRCQRASSGHSGVREVEAKWGSGHSKTGERAAENPSGGGGMRQDPPRTEELSSQSTFHCPMALYLQMEREKH